ncbi:hypothetical protein [Paracoccus siganidrum]|uniref:hypothetical protein n=1 Tax=Paracoccus siganidrum TaxID=1276757 RepID=UPI0011C44BF9|nr:hypothetical protein [Paracoccus siganidrum]
MSGTRIVSRTYAAFGDVTVPVGERLRLSAGLRLARDEQDFTAIYEGQRFPGSVPRHRQDSRIEDDYVTGPEPDRPARRDASRCLPPKIPGTAEYGGKAPRKALPWPRRRG